VLAGMLFMVLDDEILQKRILIYISRGYEGVVGCLDFATISNWISLLIWFFKFEGAKYTLNIPSTYPKKQFSSDQVVKREASGSNGEIKNGIFLIKIKILYFF
jgi:hypothetical protein